MFYTNNYHALHKLLKHRVFIKKPELVKRIVKGYFNTIIRKKDVLRSVELAVTYGCQASCHKCYAAKLKDPDKSYLTISQIENIIQQAKSLGLIHVNITGGEPVLRSDLPDIVRMCSPDEIMVSIVTNAAALTWEKMKALKRAGLNTLQISLDSSDPGIHDRLRGIDGAYDAVMQAAAWARELKLNLCFSTVMSTEECSNESEMSRLLSLCEREKAFLLICDSAAVGGWENQHSKMMSCKQRNETLDKLLNHPLARHHHLYNFRMRSGCPAGVEKIYITAYGDVTPCDLIHTAYGSVLGEPLKRIWDKMRNDPLYSEKHVDCVRYLDAFQQRSRS